MGKDTIRLPQTYRKWLKKKLLPLGTPYIFGSRASADSKGGDIDILLLSAKKRSFIELAHIRKDFIQQFGDQKLDLVNFTYEDDDPFKKLILLDAKAL